MTLDNATINSRLLIILVVIVGLISAIGVIISSVALSKPSAPDISISTNNHPISADWLQAGADTNLVANVGANSRSKREVGVRFSSRHENDRAKTVWTIALGYDNGAHDYRSEDGSIQGFGVDLVEAVCAAVGLECRIVFDLYQNCWTSVIGQYGSGGQGLLGHWYDACVGWSPTKDRLNVFNFSPSYTRPSASKLFIKAGNKNSTAGLLKGSIGFIRGFASDERCLAEGRKDLAANDIVYVDTPQELVRIIQDDKVGAIFSSDDVLARYINEGGLQAVEGSFWCAEDGYAVMTHKDSAFLSLWNLGMEKLKKSGALTDLCQRANSHHAFHGVTHCRDD